MVIRLVAKSNSLFPELPQPLAVDLHSSETGLWQGVVLKDISHVVEQSGHRQHDRRWLEVIQALQEELYVGVALVCCPVQPVDGCIHVVGNVSPHEVQLVHEILCVAVINYNCVILDTSPVHIGANAFIAPGICMACSGHSVAAAQRAAGTGTSAPITLDDDVWIGANATICGGVTIGAGSIIGAGSVVTRDIPAGVIAAGNPCRVLRAITEKDKVDPTRF